MLRGFIAERTESAAMLGVSKPALSATVVEQTLSVRNRREAGDVASSQNMTF